MADAVADAMFGFAASLSILGKVNALLAQIKVGWSAE